MSEMTDPESPIVNTPNTPQAGFCYDDGLDPDSGCAQWLPLDALSLYVKFVLFVSVVVGGFGIAVFWLFQYFAQQG